MNSTCKSIIQLIILLHNCDFRYSLKYDKDYQHGHNHHKYKHLHKPIYHITLIPTLLAIIKRGIDKIANINPNTKNKINKPFVSHVNRIAANRCCRNPTYQKSLN